MMVHDPRIALASGDRLTLCGQKYKIQDVIGFGGSCLAYCAEPDPSENEHNIDIPIVSAIIKEFYPRELADSMTREPDGRLIVNATAQETFDMLKKRFEKGAVEQTAFCVSDSNHSLSLPLLDFCNGTVYTVASLIKGQMLAECAADLPMIDKSDVITSLCNSIKKLHNSGKLYLDLKPSNIFVFEKEQNESRRIALFDFDTVIAAGDADTALISYSDGWSPYEQRNPRKGEISFAADIYSIGAVYYWMLSGKKLSEAILDAVVRERFDFLDEVDELRGNKRLKETIGQIFSSTLKRLPEKRAQRVEDISL